MIDFIKAHARVEKPLELIRRADPDLYAKLNFNYGEIIFPLVCSINRFKIRAFESGLVHFSGSPHKIKNGGDFNYDDFTFSQIKKSIHAIFERFDLPFNQIRLENVEFGVNINPTNDTNAFVNGLILYGRKFFDYVYVKGGRLKSYRAGSRLRYKRNEVESALREIPSRFE